jgi:hypothetical protein
VTVDLLPGLQAPGAHWPLWDVHVYWRGGQQPALGGPPYAPGAPSSFTYPPLAATVAAGAALLPSQSRVFWLDGVFADQSRIGNPANPSGQSLAGAAARLAGGAAAAALALTRERAAARAGIDRNRGPSPRMRWLVT